MNTKYCGVVLILFGWFLRVSFLHVLVFLQKTFCDFILKKKFPCLLTVRSRGNPRERGSAIDVASGYYESFWVPLSKFSFEAIALF